MPSSGESFETGLPILDPEASRVVLTMVQTGAANAVVNGVVVQNGVSNNQVCAAVTRGLNHTGRDARKEANWDTQLLLVTSSVHYARAKQHVAQQASEWDRTHFFASRVASSVEEA